MYTSVNFDTITTYFIKTSVVPMQLYNIYSKVYTNDIQAF